MFLSDFHLFSSYSVSINKQNCKRYHCLNERILSLNVKNTVVTSKHFLLRL
jgi:hypothetical protein